MPDHDKADAGPSGLRPDSPTSQRTLTITNHQLDSHDLFASAREIVIAHGIEHYRLRLTAQNKLILTK
jgi:hemin uptake protein HemP